MFDFKKLWSYFVGDACLEIQKEEKKISDFQSQKQKEHTRAYTNDTDSTNSSDSNVSESDNLVPRTSSTSVETDFLSMKQKEQLGLR